MEDLVSKGKRWDWLDGDDWLWPKKKKDLA